MVHPSLPRWSTLNKTSKEMDCNSAICPMPGPILGIQQSPYNKTINESSIKVKITSMHILVLAFTISDTPFTKREPHYSYAQC